MKSGKQQEVNNQIFTYLNSLVECTAANLRRIDRESYNMEEQIQRSFSKLSGFPQEEIEKWKEEEIIKHFEDCAFLIKEFNRLNYTPPIAFQSSIEKMLDLGIDNVDSRDLLGDIEDDFSKKMELLYITTLPSYKKKVKEGSYVSFKEQFNEIEPKALKSMMKFYRDYFEFIVNKMFRGLYAEFIGIYTKGVNSVLDELISKNPNAEKIGCFTLIEFFKEAWKQSPIFELLEYLKPVIRNAIDHDLEHGELDINYTKRTIFFKSKEHKLKLSIGEFIANYWTAVSSLYQTVMQLVPTYRTPLKIEMDVVDILLKNSQNGNNSEKKRLSPISAYIVSEELGLFARTYNSLIRTQDNLDSYNTTQNEFKEFMATCLRENKHIEIIPHLLRYIISDNPFSKPISFRKQVCEKYLEFLEQDSFADDINMIRDYLTEIAEKNGQEF